MGREVTPGVSRKAGGSRPLIQPRTHLRDELGSFPRVARALMAHRRGMGIPRSPRGSKADWPEEFGPSVAHRPPASHGAWQVSRQPRQSPARARCVRPKDSVVGTLSLVAAGSVDSRQNPAALRRARSRAGFGLPVHPEEGRLPTERRSERRPVQLTSPTVGVAQALRSRRTSAFWQRGNEP